MAESNPVSAGFESKFGSGKPQTREHDLVDGAPVSGAPTTSRDPRLVGERPRRPGQTGTTEPLAGTDGGT